jgi:16S rRNA (cytosine1402-N4)-methyltransferase
VENRDEGEVGHEPVLLEEVLRALGPKPDGLYLDCTIGGAGHAEAILKMAGGGSHLVGIDRDAQAIERGGERLKNFGGRAELHHGRFEDMKTVLAGRKPDGILMDLGVSSFMLDDASRGFSFRFDAPLDMRMDRNQPLTAAEIVNTWPEAELVRIFRQYGEERLAPRIARRIIREREITSTHQLAELVATVYPKGKQRIHPATRVFMALRIAVNGELDDLDEALSSAAGSLAEGGRLAVISFHSLEDRIVKRAFVRLSTGCVCPPRMPICTCGKKALMKLVTKRPIAPSEEETARNPRSRSALLRVVEKAAA